MFDDASTRPRARPYAARPPTKTPKVGASSRVAKPAVATTSPTRTTMALDERAATSSATTEPTPASSTTMRSSPLTASSSSDHFCCTCGRRVVSEMKSRPCTKKAVPAASRDRSREEDSARTVTVGHTVAPAPRRQDQSFSRQTVGMLRLTVTIPADLTERVTHVLGDSTAVSTLSVLRGAAVRPVGDVVHADVAREGANVLVDRLRELGVHHDGTLQIEPVTTWVSRVG